MQKFFSVIAMMLSIAMLGSAVAWAGNTVIEKLTLKPGEVKKFSIPAQAKMKIGFTPLLSHEESRKCKQNCIEISQTGGITMASQLGATIGMKPKNGKIDFKLKNVESFPIEVELFHK
jgi:hypothetical protein